MLPAHVADPSQALVDTSRGVPLDQSALSMRGMSTPWLKYEQQPSEKTLTWQTNSMAGLWVFTASVSCSRDSVLPSSAFKSTVLAAET